MSKHAARALVVAIALTAAGFERAGAQAVVDRTPNLDDGWAVRPGTIQFNFLHRFEVSPPPLRKVTSFPNFHLATGLPFDLNAAVDYATNSTVFTGIPNEYQLSLRRPILRQSPRLPLDVGVTAAYNFAPQSVDGELTLGRRLGVVHVLGTVRGMSSGYNAQRSVWGAGIGAVVRLTSWLSLAGDVFDLVDEPASVGGTAAWGAGVQLRIPYSPHSVSIQVTNTQNASIEGAARGVRGAHMAGFEFTVPFTVSRYFGRRDKAPAEPAPSAREGEGEVVVVPIERYGFGTRVIRVRPGTRVRWVNRDPVEHSVTAVDKAFDSGLISPTGTFEHTFEQPGAYTYFCRPHPFMSGRVIVEP